MEETTQPIPDAQINAFRWGERGSIFIMECSIDEFGKAQRVELGALDSLHLTDIHSLARPYSQYDIHVAKEGYDTEAHNGVQIPAGIGSVLTVIM